MIWIWSTNEETTYETDDFLRVVLPRLGTRSRVFSASRIYIGQNGLVRVKNKEDFCEKVAGGSLERTSQVSRGFEERRVRFASQVM